MIQKKAVIFMHKEQLSDNLKSDKFNHQAILFEIFRDFLSPDNYCGFTAMTTEITSNPDYRCERDTMVFAWAMPDFDESKDYKKCITISKTYTFDDPENEGDDRFDDFVESFIYFDVVHRAMKFFNLGQTYFPRGLNRMQSMVVNIWTQVQDTSPPLMMGFEDWMYWEEFTNENFVKKGLTVSAEYNQEGDIVMIARDPKKLPNPDCLILPPKF